MDRAAAECARFLASHLDLGSCLEIRSAPGVTTNSKKAKSNASSDVDEAKPKERKSSKELNKNGVIENGKAGAGATGNGAVEENVTENGVAGNGEAKENGDETNKDVDLVICLMMITTKEVFCLTC